MSERTKDRKDPIPPSEWEWFGHAAHFICGRWCRFHMATLVGPWLVSTVGEYVHPSHSGGSARAEYEWLKKNHPGADIGWNRKYETMVFRAGEPCREKDCGCGLPTLADATERAVGCYMTAKEATEGHRALCAEWAKREVF